MSSIQSLWSSLHRTRLSMYYYCLVFVVIQIVFQQVGRSQVQLKVAYITTNGGQYISNGSIPAVMLAVEKVNNASSDRYHLQLATASISGDMWNIGHAYCTLFGKLQCDRTDSLQSYFDLIQNVSGVPLIALLGCGCSPATEPVAEISHYEDIIHMSYVSSSPLLSDRSRFQSFWRTYPSDTSLTHAVLAIVRRYGWNQLKILTQQENLFIEASQTLTMELTDGDIRVDKTGTLIFSDTETLDADMLFSPEVRIFMLDMYEEQARRVLCEAAKLGNSDVRYVSGYVWLIHGWYKQNWWKTKAAKTDTESCTDQQVEALLKRSIAILQIPTAENVTATTNVELTAEEFREQYEERLGNNPSEPSAALSYDAVWTLAKALDRSAVLNGSNVTASSIVGSMRQILSSDFSFIGVSGEVRFDDNGTRVPQDTRIFQYRTINECTTNGIGGGDLQLVQVADVPLGSNDNLTYKCGLIDCDSQCESDDTVWPNGIPVDGTPKKRITTVYLPIFIIYAIFATAGMVFVIVCLVFNIIFRQKKIVKLTSPKLNYVVLFGAFLLYASIFFYVLPSTVKSTSTVYCHIRAWLQPVGYLFCFGTIMLKMWRVYYIFLNPSLKKKRKVPKDWMLFLGVLAMVGVAAITLIAALIFDDYKATEVEDKETGTERDENKVLVEHFNLVCEGKRSDIWVFGLFFYSLGTQIVAVYLAFRTRKVKIKVLNDAKYLAFIIYSSSVILTVMIIGVVALRNFLNADAAVYSTCLLLFTTLILVLLFVPKMVILYKDPRGEFIFNRGMSQMQITNTGMSLNDSEREKLRDLEVHCRDIENRLSKYESVRPFRSLSRSKLVNSNTDLASTVCKTPINSADTPQNSLHLQKLSTPSNGHSNTGDVGDAEIPVVIETTSPTPEEELDTKPSY